jgi:acyl-CoA thioesterase FadM
MSQVRDTAVAALLDNRTTARVRPVFEGNNISYAIGFKHINYVAEAAVLNHFREAGWPAGALYKRLGLGFEVVEIRSRLGALLDVDDEAEAVVTPATKDGANEFTFKVAQFVQRDGERVKCADSTVRVALRIDGHTSAQEEYPAGLERFAVTRLGDGERRELAATPRPYGRLGEGRGVVGGDPVLDELIGEENAFGWRWRIPYFYCHFNERVQMSGFLRIMEEAEDLFLAERGLAIKEVLDSRNWIPVVTQSQIRLLGETRMEEELYTVYTIENIFKSLLYTARMDCYVVRDGALVKTATGTITHGYLTEHAPNQWSMATLDESAVEALSTPKRVTA